MKLILGETKVVFDALPDSSKKPASAPDKVTVSSPPKPSKSLPKAVTPVNALFSKAKPSSTSSIGGWLVSRTSTMETVKSLETVSIPSLTSTVISKILSPSASDGASKSGRLTNSN